MARAVSGHLTSPFDLLCQAKSQMDEVSSNSRTLGLARQGNLRFTTAQACSSIYISKAPCTELRLPTCLLYRGTQGLPILSCMIPREEPSLLPSFLQKRATVGPMGSSLTFSSKPSCFSSTTWLQTRLLFQKVSEDAFGHLQQQKRITKECFFPVAKEENVLEHFSYCREVFPTKMICLSRKGKSLLGDDTDQHFRQEYQVLWA